MGNQTSQCFALFYLNRIDRIIKERYRIKYYVRHMDDMILLVTDKIPATKYLNLINDLVISEKLILNKKSQIIPIKNGVTFLSWHLFYGSNGKVIQKLPSTNKARVCKYLKKNKTIVGSLKGHLARENTYFFYRRLLNKIFMRQL